MNKFTSYFISFAAFVLLINVAVPVLQTEAMPKAAETVSEIVNELGIGEAQAAQGGPSYFRVGIQDDSGSNGQCNQQYADYGVANYTPPSGQDYGYVTDGNGKDPNCARIFMDAGDTTISGGSMYTTDFRIGITLAESENGCTDRRGTPVYTGWASDGGGTAATYATGSIEAADCIWIYYQTRPMPNGAVRVVDAQAGIGVGNGAMQYTPWASSGSSWSGWSTTSGKDFRSARIALNTRLNYKYNADYVSTTIPQYPPNNLTKNQTLTNRNIVMKNIPDVGATSGMPWTSDQVVTSSTNRGVSYCDQWTPTGPSETCTQTTVYTSSKFKLRRIDNVSGVTTTSGDLTYKRTVVSQWGAAQVWYEGQCYPTGGGPQVYKPSNERTLANAFGLINIAQAAPIDPPEEQCDPPYPSNPPEYNAYFISQNQTPDVQVNESATFELDVTPTVDGDHQLQFQMVDVGVTPNERFGDPNAPGNSNTIARINIRVGTWGLSCTANVTTVVGQVASYAINATGNPTGPISVTLTSGSPPTMTNSPLILNSTNSYSGVATLSTTGMTPGVYPLTFTGNDGSVSTNCPAQLTLSAPILVETSTNLAIYQWPTAPLTVNGGSEATVTVGQSVTLTWTPSATLDGTYCTAGGSWSGNRASTPGSYNFTTGALSTPGTYTYNISCKGALLSDSPLSSVTVYVLQLQPFANITCEGLQNSCTIPSGSTATIDWSSQNVDSCDVLEDGVRVWTGLSGTEESPSLTSQTVYTVSCTGPNGPSTDTVTVNISGPPQTVNASSAVCGAITISWTVPSGSTPDGYNIYRRTTSSSFGAPIATNVPSSPYSDTTANYNTLYIYGVAAVYGGVPSAIEEQQEPPLSPILCAPDLTGSDKDLTFVESRTSTGLDDCSNVSEVPSNYQIANSGDLVGFSICIINSGTEALTNVTVTELPNANQYTQNLTDIAFSQSGSTCTGTPSGTTWVIGAMAVGATCSINITARIAEPAGPAGDLYRFQNIANITASSLSGPVSKQVRSALLLFAKGSGIPDREETAP